MEENQDLKIDPQLQLALNIPEEQLENSNLNTGYNKNLNLWEVIVKYNGNLENIKNDLNVFIEILSSQYAIITLSADKINILSNYQEIEYIEQPRNLNLMLNTSLNASCINSVKNSPTNLTGKGVIIGIIDSGINYTHKDFINEDGTSRILYIWDQEINGNPPKNFLGGSVYTNEDINKALKDKNPLSVLPHKDDIGHGTHIAGIAAGNGRTSNKKYEGVAPESSLIIVKIGNQGIKSFAKTTEIMRAIKFTTDKAIELNMPLVINLSFGTNDGSHNGNSLFETYIDDISNIWKTSIVVATGNEGYSSHHYKNTISNDQEIVVEFSTSSDLKSLYLVLWKNFTDSFNIQVIAPNGEKTSIINNSSIKNKFNFNSSTLYINLGQPTPYNLEQEIFFEIISNNGFLSRGTWKIIIYGEKIVDGEFDIWLPVTEFSSNDTKFLQPDIYTTLTIPSTANNVISVGAYNSEANSIADFSGRGYKKNNLIKPDLVAPGVNITSTSNTGGYNTLSGTSMAAPHVSGACALLMQWGIVEKNDPFLYGQRIKAFLRLGARRKNNLTYPNKEWGYGSLCLSETLNQLNIFKQRNYVLNTNRINTTTNLNDIVFSEDYVSLIIDYNLNTENIIKEYDNVYFCGRITGDFAIIYVEISILNTFLKEQSSQLSIQFPFLLGEMNTDPLNESGILAVQNQPYLNLNGQGVLIGIVDSGIDYTVNEFIYEDGTSKIINIWDQTLKGEPKNTICFGTEYTNDQINQALKSTDPHSIVATTDDTGHGTRLASICAGRENAQNNFIGVAPNSELIIVKLRQASSYLRENYLVNNEKIAYESNDLILGVEYLYQKSIELRKPIAICIGLGSNSTGHTGMINLERFLSAIATKNGIALSVCSGNEGNAFHHAIISLDEKNEYKTLELKVGENESGFVLSIYSYFSDKLNIEIISPINETTNKIFYRYNFNQNFFFALSNTNISVYYESTPIQEANQIIFIKFKNPSSGIWKINISSSNYIFGDIHSWLPIKQFLNKDTYFLNSNPFYTVTIPGTANSILTVGGYNSFDGSFFVDSGRGPTRLGLIKPFIVAPAVNISCVGPRGNFETLTGTSAATAIATGSSALLLEWGIVKKNSPIMNTTSIINYLSNGANRNTNEIYPNNLWGFGKLNLYSVFENL